MHKKKSLLPIIRVILASVVGISSISLILFFLQYPITIQNKAQENQEKLPSNENSKGVEIYKEILTKKLFPKSYIKGRVIVKLKNVSPAEAFTKNLLPDSSVDISDIIKDEEAIGRLRQIFSDISVSQIEPLNLHNNQVYIKLAVQKENIQEVINLIKKDKNVEYAQPDYIYTATSHIRDEYFLDRNPPSPDRLLQAGQGIWNPDFDYQWNLRSISQPHDFPAKNQSVVVAVIDTGVDYNHKELSSHMWSNSDEIVNNGIDDDKNGYIDDTKGWDALKYDFTPSPESGLPQIRFVKMPDNDPLDEPKESYFKDLISVLAVGGGHGTHVAGIVSSSINNYGSIGVGPDITIMPLRAMTADGWGPDSGISEMIIYAANNGARVINLSLGGYYESPIMLEAIKYAVQRNVIVIAAAGNDHSLSVGYPAGYDEVVSVGAIDRFDAKSEYSNVGKIDLAAPGSSILSLRGAGTDAFCLSFNECLSGQIKHTDYVIGKNQDHYIMSGTSMASPHVAGLAGLILLKNPSLTENQVKGVMFSSADDLGNSSKDGAFGYGKINVSRALNEMNTNIPVVDMKRWNFATKFVCKNNSTPWEASYWLPIDVNNAIGMDQWKVTKQFSFYKHTLENTLSTVETPNTNSIIIARMGHGHKLSNGIPVNLGRKELVKSLPHSKMNVTKRGDEIFWNANELPNGNYTLTYEVDDVYCQSHKWEINTKIVCPNGNTPEANENQLLYLVWPPNPVKWQKLETTTNFERRFVIEVTPTYHKIYIALRDKFNNYLQPRHTVTRLGGALPMPPEEEYITFSNFGSNSKYPVIDWYTNDSIMANFLQRDGFIEKLSFEFFAPEKWCQ